MQLRENNSCVWDNLWIQLKSVFYSFPTKNVEIFMVIASSMIGRSLIFQCLPKIMFSRILANNSISRVTAANFRDSNLELM